MPTDLLQQIEKNPVQAAWRLPAGWQRRYEALLHQMGLLAKLKSAPEKIADETSGRKTAAGVRVGVAACIGKEGASTVAAHLAAAAAAVGIQTLLVDTCSCHNPSQHARFSVSLHPGWAEFVQTSGEQPTAILPLSANLWLLPAGKRSAQATRAHDVYELHSAVKEISAGFAMTLFDLPPASQSTMTLRFAGVLDGLVLVADAGRTSQLQLRRAAELVRRSNGRLLGVVLNRADPK